MKNNFSLFYFLFFITLIYSQEKEYKNGTIITNELDTLSVKIEILDEYRSISIIKYISKTGKTKKINTTDVKSYSRGNEYFKTITISNNYKLFGKRTLNSANFSIISRAEQNVNSNNQLTIYSKYSSHFLENKYGRSIKIPTSKKKFRKNVSGFLLEYPNISERVRNGELDDIIEIISLCN